MNILALIPARGGSKGVPQKNIKLLENYPLISYTIAAAKLSEKINRVLVSTDSQEIADISLQFDAEVPFLRPSELASDTSTDIDFIIHALNWLETNENYIPDFVVLLRPTTPLREIKFIDQSIEILIQNNEATSLRSSHLVAETPFKWFSMEEKYYAPISDKYTLEDTNKPRQFFPDVYIPNGYVDILKPDFIKKHNSLYGNNILGYITPVGYEVDTINDFEYIEYQISKNNTDLLKYLEKKRIINNMDKTGHVNLSAYDEVEQLSNFTEKSFKLYCDEKIKGCEKHITFFKKLFSNDKKLKVCEIGSGNSKLLYALDKEEILETGVGIEISNSRYMFAEKFKKYMESTNIKNINKNIFDIEPVKNFNIVIGVDIVMQLISPISKNSEKDFLKWSYDSLCSEGIIVLELWSFEHILKQLELSAGSLKFWEEYPQSDPFEYLLSKVYLNNNNDICWDKTFIKRNKNEKSLFSNILRPYAKTTIEKILINNGFYNVEFFSKWSNGSDYVEDEYIVIARKKEKK